VERGPSDQLLTEGTPVAQTPHVLPTKVNVNKEIEPHEPKKEIALVTEQTLVTYFVLQDSQETIHF